MPIRLTWTSPSQFVVGYIVYRRQGNGLINKATDFYQNLSGGTLLFNDTNYNRTTLETVGYTYGVSALGPAGEGPMSITQFTSFNFDEELFVEEWDPIIPVVDDPQFVEEWEFALGLLPNQLYLEGWEL
jgi:hypothetical protein